MPEGGNMPKSNITHEAKHWVKLGTIGKGSLINNTNSPITIVVKEGKTTFTFKNILPGQPTLPISISDRAVWWIICSGANIRIYKNVG